MRFLFSTRLISTSLRSPRAVATVPFRSISADASSPVSRSAANPKAATASSSTTAMTAVSSSEEGLAARLWVKFRRECLFSMYSPFAVCLAAGNLKIETFRHYIAQDVHFLKAFAQAYELAEECADDDDDKLAISDLRKSVMEELKMHNSVVQEWGVDVEEEVSVNSATLRYTEFLLATASGKVEGIKAPGMLDTPFEKTKVATYTLGAVAPCMKLYAFLGKEFEALVDLSDGNHPYKKWIENYSCEDFQTSAKQTEDLLEKLSVCMTGEELDIIEKLYQQAMKLEIEFFHAQPLAQPTIVPLTKEHNPEEDHLMIFSDFDLTCSVVDSSAILAEIAIVTAPKSDQSKSEQQIHRMVSVDLKNTWTHLSKQYTEEYEECIENVLKKEKVDAFDYEGLCKALEQLSDFEKMANLRVIDSGVLKGLNLEDIKRAGERLILQDGCLNFFQRIVKNEILSANVHVLSYCWCGDLIRAAFSAGGFDALKVHANELTFEESISTGEITRKVESPIDKAREFKTVLHNRSSDKKSLLTVYIGDSVGDLLCLLEADIGIVVGSSSSLRRVGSHFGISFVPLFSGIVQKQKQKAEDESSTWKGLSGTLYTVSSWAEIHAFFLGW
ncbi:PREDICTED: probable aminopyrimidine aminohydrolase, mitochondrial [Tarenaya hassleriana]|uniref:probable aminopyrimidine aminohydrolase, mitochondrial n=1 Tax=Tarenaya hassleriana TaxID=28532 RepID=UPI00053C3DD0|nr:PREDICTED: probable aminopyrimidine aminohydrolase, mitochondrial [Tarenaya hassleriana]